MNYKISSSSYKTTVIALLSATALTVILLTISSDNPIKSIVFFFTGPFQTVYNLGNMLDKAGLLILAGLGMSIAFKAGVFNLGGEGQAYAGASTAIIISLNMGSAYRIIGISAAVGTGIITGALIAGISGYLKKQWDTDELISSFLLSGVMIHLTDYLISGPLRDNNSFLVSTVKIPSYLFLTRLLGPSHFNISFLIAIGAAVTGYFFIFKSPIGYEIRLSGLNRKFANYGGINAKRHFIIPMLISGGLYGAAGSFAVLGNFHMGIKGFTEGLGWNGIAVALIAGNNPILIVPAGLVFAYLNAGTQVAMIHSDLSFEFSNLIKAVIFFLITARKFNTKKGVSLD